MVNSSKPWLKHYPKGVPYELGSLCHSSLSDFMDECFERFASRRAIEAMGSFFTYDEINHLSKNFASYLASLNLEKGSRVALMYPNVVEYLVSMVGTLRAGYTVVNINPLYTPRELEYQLKDSGAAVLVLMENFASSYEKILPQAAIKMVIVSSPGELLGLKGHVINWVARYFKKIIAPWNFKHIKMKDALCIGSSRPFAKPSIDLDDIAFLQYTGGTTGVSKGAVLLHRNILSNVMQIEAWLNPVLGQQHTDQLVFLCALPMTHIFALTACALLGIAKGGLLILVPNPRDITGFIKTLLISFQA
jgi:long-chain acyl-CoA synthetase